MNLTVGYKTIPVIVLKYCCFIDVLCPLPFAEKGRSAIYDGKIPGYIYVFLGFTRILNNSAVSISQHMGKVMYFGSN